MITNDYIKTMARYNQWQNESLYGACEGLTDNARKLDRGAFFGSIHATLCHLLWGDMLWTSRFAGLKEPEASTIPQSHGMIEDWQELTIERAALDAEILSWADGLAQGEISGTMKWYSGSIKKHFSRPLGELIVSFFNHQTHHRGQVHAMITAAGGTPDDTDLIIMSMR